MLFLPYTFSGFCAAGSALVQGSLFGMASMFPPRYIAALMKGQSVGGMAAALSNILTLAVGSGPQDSALAYFVIAELIMVVCLVSFFAIRRLVSVCVCICVCVCVCAPARTRTA